MPRRGNVPKRDVLPDPIYGNKVLTKLINCGSEPSDVLNVVLPTLRAFQNLRHK